MKVLLLQKVNDPTIILLLFVKKFNIGAYMALPFCRHIGHMVCVCGTSDGIVTPSYHNTEPIQISRYCSVVIPFISCSRQFLHTSVLLSFIFLRSTGLEVQRDLNTFVFSNRYFSVR